MLHGTITCGQWDSGIWFSSMKVRKTSLTSIQTHCRRITTNPFSQLGKPTNKKNASSPSKDILLTNIDSGNPVEGFSVLQPRLKSFGSNLWRRKRSTNPLFNISLGQFTCVTWESLRSTRSLGWYEGWLCIACLAGVRVSHVSLANQPSRQNPEPRTISGDRVTRGRPRCAYGWANSRTTLHPLTIFNY